MSHNIPFNGEENTMLVDMRRDLIQEINFLQENLETKKLHLRNIENILRKRCNHQWVIDYIDQMYPTFKEGIRIEYCKYCELNRHVT
tara:strand:- start:332 stop:592 length:261 start_codon:yes stop_codon:yes gene_type:complete